MATKFVNSTAALSLALSSGSPGDVIALAPGSYANVGAYKVNFSAPVTITSQDPKHPAVVSGLSVYNSSGLTFSQLAIGPSGGVNTWSTRVGGSNQILFSHVDFKGSAGAAPSNQASGLLIENSSNVGVQNSHFAYVNTGITETNNTYLRISANAFDHIGTDGIDNSGSSNVVIISNNFTNFQNTIGTSHPDVIQFWTFNTTALPHDITISSNIFVRGAGTPAQGIFMSEEAGLPYTNLTIRDNMILGGLWNGIDVVHAVWPQVSGNTVASWAGQDTNTGATLDNLISRITLSGISGAAYHETANAAQQYVLGDQVVAAPMSNAAIGAVDDAGASLLQAWSLAHSNQLAGLSSDLLSLLGLGSTAHSMAGLGA